MCASDLDADLPGDTLSVAAVNGSAANVGTATATTHGTVTINANGTFSYTHDGSEFFTDSFTYTVCKPVYQTHTKTYCVNVCK